ncbi:YihY/virulence factor BrkB family protein [Kaarinaea lacus]
MPSERLTYLIHNPVEFSVQVFKGFRTNQGFLLSGAIAYYTLLSMIPMTALILVLLSQFQDPQKILEGLREYFALVVPGQVDVIIQQVDTFLENWRVIGVLGILLLLFFSSFAFTALEGAMSVIFFHRRSVKPRKLVVSVIIPYVYMLTLAGGLLIVNIVSGFLHSLENETVSLFGHHWSMGFVETSMIYFLGFLGETILLTSLYLVMPVGHLSFRHALVGGFAAAVLWEITRRILVWYYSTLSMVNVIYGAFSTAIVILISLEAVAIILLLGAQVIAEYERIGTGEKQDA